MTFDVDIDEAFGLLHDLSDLGIGNWREALTPRNVLMLRSLWADLIGEELAPIEELSDFERVVKCLMEKEAYWSKAMGLAFIEADRLANLGEADKAVALLDEFLSKCSSPSFREIAQIQKENYLSRLLPCK